MWLSGTTPAAPSESVPLPLALPQPQPRNNRVCLGPSLAADGGPSDAAAPPLLPSPSGGKRAVREALLRAPRKRQTLPLCPRGRWDRRTVREGDPRVGTALPDVR
jgi:hypothetical protein